MPILTPRLCIKPRYVGEGRIVYEGISESFESLKLWMPWAQELGTVEQQEAHCRLSLANFILRKDLTLSIYTRDGSEFLGSTGFHDPDWEFGKFEIGYWICKKYEGQGFVSEAVNALTRYAFDALKARRVEIRCNQQNKRSLAVINRLGFEVEGILKNFEFAHDGSVRNTVISSRSSREGLPDLDVSWE